MENAAITMTPLQMLLAFALQIWFIIFPIIIIRKINYLTELMRAQLSSQDEEL